MRNLILISFVLISSTILNAQTKNKIEEVNIQTSAICGDCKVRIESALYKHKGVVSAELNLETSVVKISFRTNKTNAENLKAVITKVGYDADDLKADQTAYDSLPGCCRKGNTKH